MMASSWNPYTIPNIEEMDAFTETPPDEFYSQSCSPGDGMSNLDYQTPPTFAPGSGAVTGTTATSTPMQQTYTNYGDTTGYDFQVSLPGSTGHGTSLNIQYGGPILPNQFGECPVLETDDQWLNPINPNASSLPMPLPGPRADPWTPDQEDFLMESKKNGKTFRQIQLEMGTKYSVNRNPNVLSKKYRAIIERKAKENVIGQILNGLLPDVKQCFDDRLAKLTPDHADPEYIRFIREQIQRELPKFLPKFVQGLDLERKRL